MTKNPPARGSSHRSLLLTSLIVAAILAVALSSVFAQVTSTWSGGAGNWQPCPQDGGTALWDTCAQDYYPGKSESNDTAIVQGGPVTLGTGEAGTVANLSVASGDSVIITPGYLDITGTSIVNNGSIIVGAGDGLALIAPATVTLSGSGSVTIESGARFWGSTGGGATLINQSTIQGQGALGVEQIAITNQGIINANASGATMSVQPASMTNTGTMEASSGSTLAFTNGGETAYNNTGGTIQALSGGIVQLEDGTYTGGTLSTTGSGVIQLSADAIINNLTNSGALQVSDNGALLQGTVTNNGTITVQSSGQLYMSGNVTLAGSGSVILSSGFLEPNLTSVGIQGGTLVNPQLIHGAGEIYELPLTNQGTISADSNNNTLALVNGATTNTATLEASSGGTLEIATTVTNTGGTIEALTGSTVELVGTVSGGTLTTAGTGTIQSQNGTLDGTVNIVTNAGTLDVSNEYDLSTQGTINNTGTINLTGGSCIALNQATTLTGSGTVIMANACVTGSAIPFTNESTIEGYGSIGDSNHMPITNTGTIIANQSGNTLIITPDSTGFTNSKGTLIVNAGSTMNVEGTMTNLSKGALTGGTYNVSGMLDLPASIVTNNANITLNGAGAQIYDAFDSVNALAGFTTNGKATLMLQNGASLTTTANVSNKGTITVGAGSSLTTGGTFTQTAKTVTVDGTLTAPTGLALKKGTIQGQGTLAAAVTSTGLLLAGDSLTAPGVLTVNGSYTQEATGTLEIPINGTQLGSQYSQLAVSNGVSLNGILEIKLAKKFVPAVGTNFTVLTASVVSGQFSSVKGTSINSNEHFEVNYNSGSVVLTAVSGP